MVATSNVSFNGKYDRAGDQEGHWKILTAKKTRMKAVTAEVHCASKLCFAASERARSVWTVATLMKCVEMCGKKGQLHRIDL